MPSFKHSYTDFSRGEISEKNVTIFTSPENKNALSYLENATTTKTKGIKRRSGTILGPSLHYPLDSVNPDVKSFDFYVDEDNSFLGVMYPVLSTDLTGVDKTDFEAAAEIQPDSRAMVFEFWKYDGLNFTFNTRILQPFSYSDMTIPLTDFYLDRKVKNFSNDWVTVKDFNFDRYLNIGVFTHNSGKIEPFCVFFNGNNFEFSNLRSMLAITDPARYTFNDDAYVGYTPMTQPNSNPNIALELERVSGAATQTFYITARVLQSGSYVDFSSAGSYSGAHPFKGLNNIVRVQVLGKTYYLRYTGNEVGGTVTYLQDPSDTTATGYGDRAVFSVIENHPGASDLHTVLGGGNRDISDFQYEAFSVHTSYPTNSHIYSQRLILKNNDTVFASATGNLFFFNQYRLDGDPLTSVYTGAKVDSDPFDFAPVQKDFSKRGWLSSSGDVLEIGGLSNIQNVRGTEDSVFSFTSVKSDLGVTEGSTKSISEKLNNFTLFIGSNNKSLRDYRYDGRIRSYISNDLNQLNPAIVEHLYSGSNVEEITIKDIAIDRDNDLVYVTLLPSNAVISCRYSAADSIASWSRFTLGDEITLPASIYSVSHLRLGNQSSGVTAFVTSRDSNTYVEFLSNELEDEDANPVTRKIGYTEKDLYSYLDFSSRFIDPAGKRVWDLSGTDYVRKNVSVMADGYLISNLSIGSDGILTLDRDVKALVVGYKYNTKIRCLPIEPSQGSLGDTLADLKHVNSVHLRLHNSYGGYIKIEGSEYEDKIPYDSDNMIVGEALKMFTGYLEISPEICSSEDISVEINSDLPYPLEISAIVVRGEVNDG